MNGKSSQRLTRRDLLKVVGASGVAAGLAGCSGDDGGGSEDGADSTTDPDDGDGQSDTDTGSPGEDSDTDSQTPENDYGQETYGEYGYGGRSP
jgi:hypothetical protein